MLKSCRKKVSKQTCIYLYFHFNFNLLQKYSDINKKNNHLFETKRILQPKVCLRYRFWLRLSSTVNLLLATSSEKYARYNIFFLCSKRFALEHKEIPILLWSGVSYEPTMLEWLRFGCSFTLRRLSFNPQPWPSLI